MTVTSFPYVAQDTTDIEYGYLFREFKGDGVVGSSGDNNLKPTGDSTGMQVKVAPGSLIMRGYMMRSTAIETVPVPTAFAGASVARLVAELNLSAPTIPERIKLKVVAGVSGSSNPPALVTSDTAVHQLSLGLISVGASASTISAANVLDDRNWISNEIGQWPTSKRPAAPRKWQLGYNETLSMWEYWNGSAWVGLADWSTLSGVPSTFPPSAHNQDMSTINGLTAALADLAPKANPTFTGTITGNLAGRVNGIWFYKGTGTPTTPAPVDGDVWFSA